MRIFSKGTLRDYWVRHRDAEQSLRDWYRDAKGADWSTPVELRNQCSTARIVAGNRVVFNIKGNDHRLVVRIDYANRMVFVRFIGTHAEYDRIDATEV